MKYVKFALMGAGMVAIANFLEMSTVQTFTMLIYQALMIGLVSKE